MIEFIMELLTDCFCKLPGERFKGRSPVLLRIIILLLALIALNVFAILIWWVSFKFQEMGLKSMELITRVGDILLVLFVIVYCVLSVHQRKRNRKYLKSTVSLR